MILFIVSKLGCSLRLTPIQYIARETLVHGR